MVQIPEAVDVGPAGFSLVWTLSGPATPDLRVFADSAGQVERTGELTIEAFPVLSGDPEAADKVARRASIRMLREHTRKRGLMHVQVRDAAPDTTYYVQVLSAPDGSADVNIFPEDGTLLPVKTTRETRFVSDVRMLVLTIDSTVLDPLGWRVTASVDSAAFPVSAHVGDGAAANQAVINLANLIDATTGINWDPVGTKSLDFLVDSGFRTGFRTISVSVDFDEQFRVASVDAQSLDFDIETVTLTVEPGWNLVSLPVAPLAPAVAQVFADDQSQPAYVGDIWRWRGGQYQPVVNAQPKEAYWLFSNRTEAVQVSLTGRLPADLDIQASADWNLVGPVFDMPQPKNSQLRIPIYTWREQAYSPTFAVPGEDRNKLLRLHGYWIYSRAENMSIEQLLYP